MKVGAEYDKGLPRHASRCDELNDFIQEQVKEAYDRGYADKAIKADKDLVEQVKLARIDEIEKNEFKLGSVVEIIWHGKLKKVIITGFKDGIPQVKDANNNTRSSASTKKR